METIDIIDPKTGISHSIPFEHVHHALQSGGEFANEEQKIKAMQLSSGSHEELKDSSHGFTDYARDIGYGLAKGVKGLGEFLPNLIGGGIDEKFVHAMGKEKPELDLEWIKPKNESSLGNALQFGAEFFGPGALLGKAAKASSLGSKAINSFRNLSPELRSEGFQSALTPGVETAEENLAELTKRIQHAHKVNETRALKHKERVFEEAGKSEIPKKESEYFSQKKITKDFSPEIKEMHLLAKKYPTIENLDKLRMQIGNEIGSLKRASTTRGLDPSERNQLSALNKSYDFIKKDTLSTLSVINPKLPKLMERHWSDYEKNVVPYRSSKVLRTILKKGEDAGITPGQIKKEFSFPDKELKKILSDIGPQGSKNVLKNQLQSAKSPEGLAKAILEAKKTGGYQRHITPEMEEFAKQLSSHIKRMKIAKPAIGTALGYGLGGSIGHPAIGALLGAGAGAGKDALVKLLSQKTKI